jgi:thymidylate synthase (FAD)
MKVKLINYTPHAVPMTANLTRNTRCAIPTTKWEFNILDDDIKFIKALIKAGHLGILEHTQFTFHVADISRVTSHQLVRHRLASFLQQSGRHCEVRGYVIPKSIEQNKTALINFKCHMEKSKYLYDHMVEVGIPKEDARYILPDADYTHIAITMNARELRDFFQKRISKHAQWEIREMATQMFDIAVNTYPCMFEDLYEVLNFPCKEN